MAVKLDKPVRSNDKEKPTSKTKTAPVNESETDILDMILWLVVGFNAILIILKFNLTEEEFFSPQECLENLKSKFQREYN